MNSFLLQKFVFLHQIIFRKKEREKKKKRCWDQYSKCTVAFARAILSRWLLQHSPWQPAFSTLKSEIVKRKRKACQPRIVGMIDHFPVYQHLDSGQLFLSVGHVLRVRWWGPRQDEGVSSRRLFVTFHHHRPDCSDCDWLCRIFLLLNNRLCSTSRRSGAFGWKVIDHSLSESISNRSIIYTQVPVKKKKKYLTIHLSSACNF